MEFLSNDVYKFKLLIVHCSASEVQEDLEREMAVDENMPAVKHYHQREYNGMFEYRKEDEVLLIKNLVLGKHQHHLCLTFTNTLKK